MTVPRRGFVQSAFTLFLPFIAGGPEQEPPPPTEPLFYTLPDGLTAHLENPQAYRDAAGVVFLATRPNSGVGGLVWKQFPDGHTEKVYGYEPDAFYGLGELVIWNDGYLRYVTVEKEDHTRLVVHVVPGWTK